MLAPTLAVSRVWSVSKQPNTRRLPAQEGGNTRVPHASGRPVPMCSWGHW